MPDDAFADARLASLYDVGQRGRGDLVHYERIVAEFAASSVLDLGCGTGTLACRLAATGLHVIGVDPALASLDIARAKVHASQVQWLFGDATRAATELVAGSIDLALMTGNVAQVFLGADWDETLTAVRRLLRPGGHLVFETRDPAYRGWQEWTKEQTQSVIHSPTEGAVERWVELLDVQMPFVTFRHMYRFRNDGTERQSTSTLRFRGRDEVIESLDRAGYDVVDVRDAPDRPGKEFVFIASTRLAD